MKTSSPKTFNESLADKIAGILTPELVIPMIRSSRFGADEYGKEVDLLKTRIASGEAESVLTFKQFFFWINDWRDSLRAKYKD